MATYIIAAADGSVLQVGQCDDASFDAMLPNLLVGQPVGAAVMKIVDLPLPITELTTLTYVDDGVLRQRIAIAAVVSTYDIAADGVDEADITGLPVPCTVAISGALTVEPFELGDGSLQITSDAIGDILITVRAAPPYLSWSTTIHAT